MSGRPDENLCRSAARPKPLLLSCSCWEQKRSHSTGSKTTTYLGDREGTWVTKDNKVQEEHKVQEEQVNHTLT